MLLRSHGEQAKAFADQRIAELEAVRDGEGVVIGKENRNGISPLARDDTQN